MQRPLNARQLEAFRAVMLTGSMTAGGRLLSISQPAVSRLIQDLEAELRLTLFHRQGAHITPTREAVALHREVERHVLGSERIREAAAALRRGHTGHLRIASILTLSLNCIPRTVQRFLARYPETTITLQSGPSLEMLDLVRGGLFDLGLLSLPNDRRDVEHTRFAEAEVICVLPSGHALADKSVITPEDFDGQPMVALGPGSLMRLQFDALLHLHGARPLLRMESLYSATVIGSVCQGLGMAIIDPLAILGADPHAYVAKAFRPRIGYQISALYPAGAAPDPLATAFAEIFAEDYRQDVERIASSLGA